MHWQAIPPPTGEVTRPSLSIAPRPHERVDYKGKDIFEGIDIKWVRCARFLKTIDPDNGWLLRHEPEKLENLL